MGKKARERVLREHTFKHRAAEFMRVISGIRTAV